MVMPDQDDLIYLNGISGAGAGYLVEPFTVDQLRDRARQLSKEERFSSEDHLGSLQEKGDPASAAFGIPADATPEDLESTGWGMIFPATADPQQVDAILEAMDELVKLRKGQAKGRYFCFRDGDGYRPEETADAFVSRHGGQPGTPDVDKVPYYLLIVADPQSIPFHFQYELDVQYGVGRIYFETLDEYAQYARSVLLCETPGKVQREPRSVFFSVANGVPDNKYVDPNATDLDPDVIAKLDKATRLSAQSLVPPIVSYVQKRQEKLGWQAPELVEPLQATKANLSSYLGGAKTPALLFTASHGVGWPYGHEYQYPFQGALVTQDWPGPTYRSTPTRDMYFGAEDVDSSASLLGMVAIFFACFGGGTPYWDDYAVAQDKQRAALAHRAFLAALPRRLLGHPRGGALAVIAHVERAWGYSFKWQGTAAEPSSFQNMLFQIMKGIPVGFATEHMNLRYAQFATMLSHDFEEAKFNAKYDSRKLSTDWLASNDARGYALIGDPAVHLPVAKAGEGSPPPAIKAVEHKSGTLPVVLALDLVSPQELPEVQKEIAEQKEPPAFTTEAEKPGVGQATAQPAQGGQAPPVQQPVNSGGTGTVSSTPTAAPFATPMAGLAFALQAYSGEGQVSFAVGGEEGVAFTILDDAKNMVKDVVVNLNSALQNLSKRLLEATNEALMLEITTSLVEDLDSFDPLKPGAQKPAARFKTTISATGDIQAYLPNRPGAIDDVLLDLHKDMVEQAMLNRMETVKAIGELVASLFNPAK
jgi:hypothetical protein